MKRNIQLNHCYRWNYSLQYMRLVYWLEDYGFDYSQIVPALRERGFMVSRGSYVTKRIKKAIFEIAEQLN